MTSPSKAEDPRDKFNMRPGATFQPGDDVVIISGWQNGERGKVIAYPTSETVVEVSEGERVSFPEHELEHAEVYDFHVARGDAQEAYG